jgi:hypothetical protein
MDMNSKIHLQNLILYTAKLGRLPVDWDGYGGMPPTQKIVLQTINLLKSFSKENLIAQLDENDITPTSNGTITLSFETKKGLLSLEFGESCASCYLKLDGKMVFLDDEMNYSTHKFALIICGLAKKVAISNESGHQILTPDAPTIFKNRLTIPLNQTNGKKTNSQLTVKAIGK